MDHHTGIDLEARLDAALCAHEAGDLEAAHGHCAAILEAQPDHGRALHLLGVLRFQRGDGDGALELLERAERLLPEDPAISRHRGVVLAAAGWHEAAVAAFERALRLAPDHAETWFSLGLSLHQSGRGGEAIESYRRTLALAPDHGAAHTNLGVLLQQAGDLDGAIAAAQEALRCQPEFVPALNNLASALMECGQLEPAARTLQEVLRLNPDFVDGWINLGTVLRRLGRADIAVAAYHTALDIEPLSALAHDNLAECLFDLGRAGEVMDSRRATARAHPNDWRSHVLLGDALQRTGDATGAVAAFRSALAVAPDHVEILTRLGEALVTADALSEATGVLSRAVTLRAYHVPAQRALAKALLRLGDGAGAVAACDWTLAIDRFDQEALAYRALGLRLAGRQDEADQLADLNRWIHVTAIEPPRESGSLAAFNQALAADLRALRSRKWQPATQSIRGGTQTQNNLFDEPVATIQALRRAIDAAVRGYIESLETDPDHPFLAGRPRRWSYRAWSVVLEDSGYHVPHIHPDGWLSGACYIEVPAFDQTGEPDPGCIEFGLPWAELPFSLPPPTRRLPPAPGRLVLFPSYFWHGVRRFRSPDQRITVAFDLLPIER